MHFNHYYTNLLYLILNLLCQKLKMDMRAGFLFQLRDIFILVSTEEADDDEVIEAYTITFAYADGCQLLLRR